MASKLPRVVPIRARSGLVHDLGTQVSNLSAILNTRRWSLARRVVKRGMKTATPFVIVCY
ncbi:hypothetical protein TIFTF001_027866 [Ficus carica]|uniref:Uncharacterized protein n=1 Tax=Ficus carica TaxID=3494 RepID=A0AA88DNW5_FICCA|nr:hypothetical protein TIFTF001_027866 [Ficus carica]